MQNMHVLHFHDHAEVRNKNGRTMYHFMYANFDSQGSYFQATHQATYSVKLLEFYSRLVIMYT